MEFLFNTIIGAARGVFLRPRIAGGLYTLAVVGVLATMDRRTQPSDTPDAIDTRGPIPETPDKHILEEFKRAGLRVSERRFSRGEMIFTPGDPDEHLYFVLSGTVRVYRTYGDFKEATVALLKDGGIFGKLDLAENGRQDEFSEAATEARVSVVRKPTVSWLIKRQPELALSLFSAFSERLRQSDELIVTLLHREVSSRLASMLLNLGERHGTKDQDEVTIELRITHMELANMIASTREAVSKAMTELQRERVIEVRNRRIVILDRRCLAERADSRAAA
ncbi:MAG: Crp/Fnr family transcriptional regulator [Rubrobacteraceae bacterium]